MFQLVATVGGLTERELRGTDFLALKVPGFCYGGAGVDIGNKRPGWILFMRNTPGAKVEEFKWYISNILIPGINGHRKEFDNFDRELHNEIPKKLTSVASLDGDIPGLTACFELMQMFTDELIRLNKGNAARTGAEQACDLVKIFKLLRQLLPYYTVRDIPPEQCPIKMLIMNAFASDRLEGLNLSDNNKACIIDFCAVLVRILGQICTPTVVQDGFIENGMIDEKYKRFPDWDGILSTSKRDLTVEESANFDNNFNKTFECYEDNGEMDDNELDSIDVPDDLTPYGEVARREASIRQIHLKRCCSLNHPQIVSSKNEDKQRYRLKKLNTMQSENAKFMEKVGCYKEAIKVLNSMIESQNLGGGELRSYDDESKIKHCTLEMFATRQFTVQLMKAFVNARDPVKKMPKKGTLAEAKDGEQNLILKCFECKDKPNQFYLEDKVPHNAEALAKYGSYVSTALIHCNSTLLIVFIADCSNIHRSQRNNRLPWRKHDTSSF